MHLLKNNFSKKRILLYFVKNNFKKRERKVNIKRENVLISCRQLSHDHGHQWHTHFDVTCLPLWLVFMTNQQPKEIRVEIQNIVSQIYNSELKTAVNQELPRSPGSTGYLVAEADNMTPLTQDGNRSWCRWNWVSRSAKLSFSLYGTRGAHR